MPSKLAILYTDDLKEYDFGAGHPIRGERYLMFHRFLTENISDEIYQIFGTEKVKDEESCKFGLRL
jgi:hypothetical protein